MNTTAQWKTRKILNGKKQTVLPKKGQTLKTSLFSYWQLHCQMHQHTTLVITGYLVVCRSHSRKHWPTDIYLFNLSQGISLITWDWDELHFLTWKVKVCWLFLRDAWTWTEELVKGTWPEAYIKGRKEIFLIFISFKSSW